MTKDEIKAWDAELTSTFSVRGVVGGGLLPGILESERAAGEDFSRQYVGHTKAMDSLFDFFAGTLTQLTRFLQTHGWPAAERYVILHTMYVTLFKTFRAADTLARNGYFYHDYSMLRSVKDQAFAIAAIANGNTPTDDMFGWTEASAATQSGEMDMNKVIMARMKAEKRAEDFLLGKSSGLSAGHQDELLMWSRMFNWQVHRGMMTYYDDLKQLTGYGTRSGRFDLRQARDEQGEAMFINRCHETGWMVVRLLPFLQTGENVFSADWKKKWDMLDRTFTMFNAEFSALGKPLGEALAAMVAAKFNFNPDTRYSEHLGQPGDHARAHR